MSKDGMAYDLFNFIRKDVTAAQVNEASAKAFESKLPADLSQVKSPKEEIQQLAEEKKDKKEKADKEVNKDIKTANAGVTEEPEAPKVITDLEKKSPDAEKLTQDKDGLDPAVSASLKKAKEEKKIEPKVSGVEKVKEATKQINTMKKDAPAVKATSAKEEKKSQEVTGMKAEKAKNESVIDEAKSTEYKGYKIVEWVQFYIKGEEGDSFDSISAAKAKIDSWVKADESKLPADPSKVEDPKGDIQKLSEERALTTVSDEGVAKDIMSKYPGSRIVNDTVNGKKQFIVMVKEGKVEHKCSCDGKGACKGSCSESNAEVTIVTDDKEINVNSVDGATQVTTMDKPAEILTPAPVDGAEVLEVPAEEKEEQLNGDDDDILMAEKIYVTELLKAKKNLSEKEQKFIADVNTVVLSEAKKEKVLKALKNLKNKSKKTSK